MLYMSSEDRNFFCRRGSDLKKIEFHHGKSLKDVGDSSQIVVGSKTGFMSNKNPHPFISVPETNIFAPRFEAKGPSLECNSTEGRCPTRWCKTPQRTVGGQVSRF